MTGRNVDSSVHELIARELYRAARDAEPISPPRDRYDLSIADGYAISRRVTDYRLEREEDGEVVGYKVGFTSDAVRADLGVENPAFGYLLGGTVSTVAADATIDAGAFIAPRIEPEIAVVLGERVEEPLDDRRPREAIAGVVPVIEVVDSRIRDWDVTPPEAIADNALAAALRTGDRHPTEGDDLGRDATDGSGAGSVDLAREGVVVRKNGRTAVAGTASAVLGHPLRALAWLAGALAGRGEALEAGQVVPTGSITRPIPITAGDEVAVTFDTLGTVTIAVE